MSNSIKINEWSPLIASSVYEVDVQVSKTYTIRIQSSLSGNVTIKDIANGIVIVELLHGSSSAYQVDLYKGLFEIVSLMDVSILIQEAELESISIIRLLPITKGFNSKSSVARTGFCFTLGKCDTALRLGEALKGCMSVSEITIPQTHQTEYFIEFLGQKVKVVNNSASFIVPRISCIDGINVDIFFRENRHMARAKASILDSNGVVINEKEFSLKFAEDNEGLINFILENSLNEGVLQEMSLEELDYIDFSSEDEIKVHLDEDRLEFNFYHGSIHSAYVKEEATSLVYEFDQEIIKGFEVLVVSESEEVVLSQSKEKVFTLHNRNKLISIS